jgi:MFS transporter, SP family, sugar:H+ symporter
VVYSAVVPRILYRGHYSNSHATRRDALGGNRDGTLGSGLWCGSPLCLGPFVHGRNVTRAGPWSRHLVCFMSFWLLYQNQLRANKYSSCYQLFITVGIFTADCINYGTETKTDTGSYRIPMGIGFIWALILGTGIMFLPETPRYDWNNGRPEVARTTMSKFYGLSEDHSMIENECDEIEKVRQAVEGDHAWYETFTGPRMFYRVALAMTLQMLQQLTGANYFFYYGTTVFQGVGIQNSYVTAMILGGVNVGATFFGVYMARHFRRRESLYVAALWQFMCFMVFASVGQFVFKGAVGSTAKTAGTVMIVFSCLFIVGFATTWGPLVWACIGEMFPYRYRATAMACATSANWFWNFMLAFFTPFITGDIQYAYGYVFAGCNLAAFVVVYFFLMESSGRTLEEIDAMYLVHVPPRKSANFEFDEETRRTLGQGLNTDAMHLKRNKKGQLVKEDEADAGGVLQKEDNTRESPQ